MEKSICLFSSYLTGSQLPNYVRSYLEELSRHFGEVVFLCNEDARLDHGALSWLSGKNIRLMELKNEGYDFGMWHRALKTIDANTYGRIALVNDSCILFGRLDEVMKKINASGFDYCGLTDSNQVSYHVQSYFLVIEKPAIAAVCNYLTRHGVIEEYGKVIGTYEIGMVQYLASQGLKAGAVFSVKGRKGYERLNPSFARAAELIEEGAPLIKRKILARNFSFRQLKDLLRCGFEPDPKHYTAKIKALYPAADTDSLFKGVVAESGGLKLAAAKLYVKLFS